MFTGGTGEDYAVHWQNSVVLDTADPQEIESYIAYLLSHPEETERMRRMGRATAAQYTWERVLTNLIHKLEYQARIQGLFGQSVPGGTARRTDEHVPATAAESSQTAQARDLAPAGSVQTETRLLPIQRGG